MSEGPRPRQAVRDMAPYSPPTGERGGKLRLDFNENTVGCSPAVLAALQRYLAADALTIYPQYTAALSGLAAFFALDPAEFTLTNGTDEALQVLVNTFVDDGEEVVALRPSYAMYRFYAELAGASLREIDYRAQDLSFPLDEVLAALGPHTRALLIANPNNPTGTGIDRDGMRTLLEAAPAAAVLIDEAYFEFSGITVLPWIREYPNLFVTRTFSKAHGMAALRCGCLFSRRENLQWMKKAQSPYSVNMPAAVAACAAVQDRETVARYVGEVLAARALVYGGFERLGVPYYPSQGNFVLFRAGERAPAIRESLRAQGVLVRDRSHELAGCLRVTIGTRAQVQRFLVTLEKAWTL